MVVDELEFNRSRLGYCMDWCAVHTREKVRSESFRVTASADLNISLFPEETSLLLGLRRSFREIPGDRVLLPLGNSPRPEPFSKGGANGLNEC